MKIKAPSILSVYLLLIVATLSSGFFQIHSEYLLGEYYLIYVSKPSLSIVVYQV